MSEIAQGVKSRLSMFIDYLGLTNSAFEKKCGLSNGYIRNFKGNLGGKKLEDILITFPELNKEWLLFGRGGMLNTSINKEASEPNQYQYAMTKQPDGKEMIDKLFLLVESQRKDIETLIQLVKDKDDKIEELLEELNARKGGTATDAAHSSSVNVG